MIRPWEPLHMTTAVWREIPPVLVRIDELVPCHDTRAVCVEEKLLNPMSSQSGDPIPHVIMWKGAMYIEDGHHRIEARRRQGATFVVARVLGPGGWDA